MWSRSAFYSRIRRDFDGMNEEYAHWFPADPPARYAAKLGAEIPGLLVSIRMTAVDG